ncbi:MAG: purine-nucleoside phosphorylase, partial [Pseudonocardiaceae bacterium]
MTDPAQIARDAAAVLAQRTGAPAHDIAVVLGSGWHPVADALGAPAAEIPVTALPGFIAPRVSGHAGTVRSVRLSGPLGERRILVLLGRTHGYEGHGVGQVAHGVRTACAAGVRAVVLTNAAGGIAEGLDVGQPVLNSDHLNLTATSPLVGPRFVDLTETYSPRLRGLAREIDPGLVEGVYAGVP